MKKDLSFGMYLVIAFVIVGLADLFFNFSGMNILANLTGKSNQYEVTIVQESTQEISSEEHFEKTSETNSETTSENKSLSSTNYSEDLFVKKADDATFENNILKGNTYSVKVIDHSVVQKDGDKYVLFTYDTIVNKDYNNDDPISPYFAWSMNFNVVQDNDPDKVNTLTDIFTPDKYTNDEFAQIKPGGIVRSQVGYKLSDDTTPVKLVVGDLIGRNFGEAEYKIK